MQRQLGGFSQPRSRQMGEEPQYEALATEITTTRQPQRPNRQRQYGDAVPNPAQQQG